MKKHYIIYPVFLTVATILFATTSCMRSSNTSCSHCDSMLVVLNEYIQSDSVKTELLHSYDRYLSKFGNIQDSLAMFRRAIDSLKLVIKKRGKATNSDNSELQKYLNQIKGLIMQNQELAEDLKTKGIQNESMENLIKILSNSIESTQAEYRETERQVEELKLHVKGLETKVEKLTETNTNLASQVETFKKKEVEIQGSVKVTKPQERKAKKVQTIELTYILEANNKSETGNVPIYFRIVDPSGRVMEPTGEFEYGGKDIAYTLKSFANYTGRSVRGQIDWNMTVSLEPGTYTVDIFIGSHKGDSDRFTLE